MPHWVGNENVFHFSSPVYSLGQTSGNVNIGRTYETYLLVILDKEGKIIDTRSGRAINDKEIQFVRSISPQSLSDRHGNIVGKVDENNTFYKKALPAATAQ